MPANMKLSTLFGLLPAEFARAAVGNDIADPELAHLTDDSRAAGPGDLFVALTGEKADGRDYLAQALARGIAAAIVLPPPGSSADDLSGDPRVLKLLQAGLPVWAVSGGRRAHAALALAYYRHPDQDLLLIGVTGTNGKTTTASLVRQIAQGTGLDAAELGTLGVRKRAEEEYTDLGNTTPGPVLLARTLRGLADEGIRVVAMEVSSHAIHQHRVAGFRYRAALFTNLTQDHLDYHGTMEAYGAVKSGWIEHVALHQEPRGVAVLNLDDPHGEALARRIRTGGGKVLGYGLSRKKNPDLLADRNTPAAQGTRAIWTLPGALPRDLVIPLVGDFNVQNALAAAGGCLAIEIGEGEVLRELAWTMPPPGRFERVDAGQPYVALVDYAHTPDALENLLNNARSLLEAQMRRAGGRDPDAGKPPLDPDEEEHQETQPTRLGKLIVVFGCGGDRDRTKRPKMGAIAARLADTAVITSDNPRGETPEEIIRDVQTGLPAEGAAEILIEPDRMAAIRLAVALAGPGTLIAVAGKGAEPYQEIDGVRHPFDDRDALRSAIAESLGSIGR